MSMNHNRLLIFTFCMIFGFASCAVTNADDKVGYIDLQRLVNESDMGKQASDEIQKLRKEKQAEISEKLDEIKALNSKIEKTGEDMTPDEKKETIDALKKANKDYQRMLADAKEEIENDEKGRVADILKIADGVLKDVAKKRQYTIILKDPNAIGYLDPKVDITNDVLESLNQMK